MLAVEEAGHIQPHPPELRVALVVLAVAVMVQLVTSRVRQAPLILAVVEVVAVVSQQALLAEQAAPASSF